MLAKISLFACTVLSFLDFTSAFVVHKGIHVGSNTFSVAPVTPFSSLSTGSSPMLTQRSNGFATLEGLRMATEDQSAFYARLEEYSASYGGEAVDMDKANKLMKEILTDETTIMHYAGKSIAKPKAPGNEVSVADSCALAVFNLGVDVIGLIFSIIGVPGHITKRAARKIVNEAGEALLDEIRSIALERFTNASDLLSVGTGVWEVLQALLGLFSIDRILGAIFGEMSWWEVALNGVAISAQIVLLFAASVPGIIIKLALVTPDVVAVVGSTVTVIENCD